MRELDRREFLKHSASVAGSAVAGLTALSGLTSSAAGQQLNRRPFADVGDGGYGRLRKAGDELALPEGFQYKVLSVEGSVMSDGAIVPGRHDGMCAFPMPNGNIRLIRNHEVENQPAMDAAPGDPFAAYDPGAGGGCTSLEIDPETREVVRDFVSLNGTWRNCSGGPTPWGSWLTCEEAFYGPESGFLEYHGYVFEVPVSREAAEYTEPLTAMGRFVHEAVAVDPTTGIVYETEDHYRAGFYRFLPNDPYLPDHPGNLAAGGRLQMLAVSGRNRYDTRRRQSVGRAMPVRWVDIEDPNPLVGTDDYQAVFDEGFDRGGARFNRLEGCWYSSPYVYLVATEGGNKELGQVWQYLPDGPDAGALTLIFESPNQGTLKKPDNICVSPRGAILLCEDANRRRQYLRGLTRDGQMFDVAACLVDRGELAGVTFSPDGQTMFCNTLGVPDRRKPGMTFAVWGPWEKGAV